MASSRLGRLLVRRASKFLACSLEFEITHSGDAGGWARRSAAMTRGRLVSRPESGPFRPLQNSEHWFCASTPGAECERTIGISIP